MTTLINKLYNDDAGFIVSAELVLVATIAVLGLIVGLAEVAWNVNNELEDVGSAFTCVDQSYYAIGAHGHKACAATFSFHDHAEFCDDQDSIQCGN
ncbi:MAG: branched-chain amino acid aminotransferase [Planctomycetaceae bacterium]